MQMPRLCVALAICFCPLSLRAATTQWVHLGAKGQLVYRVGARGDRIMDFSYAGYEGGGVRIPVVPVKRIVAPGGLHNAAAIQQAIDAVSRLPLHNGFRGTVLLTAGTYSCRHTIVIRTAGVVIRGAGVKKTIIRMTGGPHLCIAVTGARQPEYSGRPMAVANRYIPSGTMWLPMGHRVSGLLAGEYIVIRHPITRRYIHFMGMDRLFRNGRRQHWVSGTISTLRRITAIRGHRIGLDAPLTDSLNPQFINPPGATVVRCEISNQISHVGLEDFQVRAAPQHGTINQRHDGGIQLNAVRNAWVDDVAIDNTVGAVSIGAYAQEITLNNVTIVHTTATSGAAMPADFSVYGSRVLINHCTDRGNHLFYFVTGARATGPNVLLNCTFYGNGSIQPHQRWATGLLVDNCRVPQGGIEFINRGEMGSGHGWTIGWAVAWNCTAGFLVVQNPPGSANWAIGCTGRQRTEPMPFTRQPRIAMGYVVSNGKAVRPRSLYLAQLAQRLGKSSLKNIGYPAHRDSAK